MEVRKRHRKKRKRQQLLHRAMAGGVLLLVIFLLFQGRGEEAPIPDFSGVLEKEEEYPKIIDPQSRIAELDQLNRRTREAAELFLRIAKDRGLPVMITETYRTPERQAQLYAQGRTAPGPVVTWTKNSQHTHRNAFDIAKNVVGEEYTDLEFFKEAAEIGRLIGLEAGYDWDDGRQDMPHFQLGPFTRIVYPKGYTRKEEP